MPKNIDEIIKLKNIVQKLNQDIHNIKMLKILFKLVYLILLFNFSLNVSLAEIIKDIKVVGNKRISTQTIILFSKAKINQNVEK